METDDFRECVHTGDWFRGTEEQLHLPAVLLYEVLVRGAVVIGLDLVGVIVGCKETEKQSVRQAIGKTWQLDQKEVRGVLRDRKVLRFCTRPSQVSVLEGEKLISSWSTFGRIIIPAEKKKNHPDTVLTTSATFRHRGVLYNERLIIPEF